ncbi:MAG: alternative ribosome rescue aminoacyl-tRNA hydrolase ArfB [Desulfobacterales bacterium]
MERIIPENELSFEFFRSSGPGGQNVNKVATAVRLRFDARNSSVLPDDVIQRLLHLAGRKATEKGEILIEAQRFRSQERNRQDAVERLESLVQRAWQEPSQRKPTRRTKGFHQKRLTAKKRRSSIKSQRRPVSADD